MASRSFAQAGSALSVSDMSHLDFSSLLQGVTRLGSTPSVFGVTCIGLVFTPPVLDKTILGLALPAQSSGRLELSSSAFDFSHADLPVFLRALAQPESPAPTSGLSCAGPVFVLPVFMQCELGLLLFIQSFGRLGLAIPLADLSHIELLMPSRNSGRLASPTFVFGIARLGSMVLVFDNTLSDSPPSLRSLACLGPSMLVSSNVELGLPLLLRQLARLGFLLPVFGLSRVALVFSLLVIDTTSFDPSMFLQSSSRLGLLLSVLDLLKLELSISLQSFLCIGSACSIVGLGRAGFVFSLSIVESTKLESFLFLQSLA